jgi:hypothetical protein
MSNNTRNNCTPEQREAWINAKRLLKTLIEKGETIRLRALHIAMSELRALRRTNPCPAETPSLNQDKRRQREELDRQARLRERIDEWKAYFADPGASKLYVIVKGDLSPSKKAVQASHAAAQFQKEHPLAPWVNGTMVLLTPEIPNRSLEDFVPWDRSQVFLTVWREPDMGDQITSICVLREFQNSRTGQTRGLKLL